MNDQCFVIAEAGVNHNGSVDTALQLVRKAAEAGADAVKFQTFTANKLVLEGAEKADYQKRETGDGDQYSMLKALEMNPAMHDAILAECKALNIEFMSTGFDEAALEYLISLGIQRIKVPSGELTNHPYLKFAASTGLPIILSTGMADMEEVVAARNVIISTWEHENDVSVPTDFLTILHCTSNYPAAPEAVNLRAMQSIANRIGCPVGYSDHTLGCEVSIAAVAMGARVIEKHFTLSRDMPGPDHKASLEPDELTYLVTSIRNVCRALGNGEKVPNDSELPVRDIVRKSITVKADVKKGQAITQADLIMLRPGSGIPPYEVDKVIGRQTSCALPAGTILSWDDIR